MAISETQQQNVIALTVGMLNAAPGATNLDSFAAVIESGAGFQALADTIASTAEFQSLYAGQETAGEKIGVALNNLGMTEGTEAYDIAAAHFAARAAQGWNASEILLEATNYLVNGPGTTNPAFSDVTAQLANKVEVATYYSVDQQISAEFDTLQAVLAGVTEDPATVETVKAEIDAGDFGQPGGGGETFTLTVDPDVATANIFEAPRGWTPGGTDQVNTLNDDDDLTGDGINPTLNLTFVDDADTGVATIAPTLNGIETINADVVGTVNKTLDLQDATGVNALNVSRINNTNYTTQNIVNAVDTMSVNNSNAPGNNVTFVHLTSALSGTEDSTEVRLNNAQLNTLRVDAGTATATAAGVGYETINLLSEGSANTVAFLSIEDNETLNITGDQNLTLGAFLNAGGSLSSIAAGDLAGDLDINLNGVLSATEDGTSGTNIALSVVTGVGDDTVRITQDTIGTTDSIDTGDGNDTLRLQSSVANNFTPATTGDALVFNVENLSMTRTATPVSVPAAALPADNLVVDMARIDGDQATTLLNAGTSNNTVNPAGFAALTMAANADGAATFTLANMSVGDATGISIQHASTLNNGLGSNIIVADVAPPADPATPNDTVAVAITEGTNNDPRFNFTLNADSNLSFNAAGGIIAGGADATNAVTNITLADLDSESNSVALTQAARHTGTITVTDGTAGTFLNLDATAGGAGTAGGYGQVLTGLAGDATTAIAGIAEARDMAVNRVFTPGLVGDQVLAPTAIAASGFAGNFEARLGVSNTNAQLGSGSDTIIFADRAGISAATSGLTIQDTVNAATGYDTVILDGGAVPITVGASEWTNLTGVDEIRVAGVAGGVYNLRLTDQLVTQSDDGGRIVIVNNDGDLRTNTENTLTVDTQPLAASSSLTFTGANGDGSFNLGARNAQTVIVDDVTANGNNMLDGGDVNVVSQYVVNGRNAFGGGTFATQAAADAQYVADVGAGNEGNDNVLQIFNTSEVTVGDLANTQNFSTINFNNDQAAVQTLNLTLDNATVDGLVDASHTATADQVETLTITATDNPAVPAATANLNVQAATVGSQFSLNVTGAGGADVIVAGAGDDVIQGGAGVDTITTGAGSDRIDYVAAGATSADADNITDFTVGGAGDQIGIDISAFGGGLVAALTGVVNNIAGSADNTIIVDTANTGYANFAAAELAVQGANAATLDYLLMFRNTTTGVVEVYADADSSAVGGEVQIASFTDIDTVPEAATFLTGVVAGNFDLTI